MRRGGRRERRGKRGGGGGGEEEGSGEGKEEGGFLCKISTTWTMWPRLSNGVWDILTHTRHGLYVS